MPRTLSFLAALAAALVLLGAAACQPAPAPQAAPPPTAAPAADTAPPRPTPQPSQPTQPPKAAPTALPVLAKSALDTLPTDQLQIVKQARQALAGGDYSHAEDLLEPLQDKLAGDQQAEVQLMFGQAQLGNRDFDEALQTATALNTSRQDLQSAARLLKGEALRAQGHWDEAATEMRAVADSNPLVAAGVDSELEDMWLQANRPDQAAIDGQKGLDLAQSRLLTIDLAEKLGTADVQLGKTDAAMDAYRQLLTAAGSKGYLGEQLYNLAEGASQLRRTDDAITALRTSISQFPRSRKAPDAVDLLEQLGGMRPEDRFYAGLIRYYFWNFRGARADFEAYLQALPDGDHAIDARYYKALSSLPKDTSAQLLQLANDVPDDDFAPMALLEAGKAQEELADYAAAESIYDRLVSAYPTRDAGMEGAFRRGLARYMRGNSSGALDAWNDLLGRDPGPSVRAKTLYWTGKVRAEQGADADANAAFQAAVAIRPVDYYVLRAKVEIDPPPSSTDFDSTHVAPADDSDLARWFASNGLDLNAAAQAASQDPAYIRATALVQHGLYKQANWEFEAFLTTYADKPDRLYWVAEHFGDMGLPNAELKLGTAALDAATAEGQISLLDVPRALARVASPLAFSDLVTSTAKPHGLDPLLLTSLMHQESDFDAYAESVAKAKGLTQIIPKTGTEIAGKLGVKDFEQTDLFQPKENLRFGAFYFAARLKRNGSVTRALASYNAGDGNVDTWTLPGRDDSDVFAEYIPFEETNNYVKKIQQYWWINRYVWTGS
jgi:soluble lytic murein transglycosylase